MSYAPLTDASNPFAASGLSREDRALLDYVLAARDATGADIVCTSTTDHPPKTASGNTSRHVQLGTDGKGLAVDLRRRTRGTARNHHAVVFEVFTYVERQLHELIYAYPPSGKRADGTTGPYNIRAGRRVAPYATSDHKDHVHVSVTKGVFVRWPGSTAATPSPTPHPATPQEAHMLFPGTQTVPIPGSRPDATGRWPMLGWKPDGSVHAWNIPPGMAIYIPTAAEKAEITKGGATVTALHWCTDGRVGYYLATDMADDRGGLNTFTFPPS